MNATSAENNVFQSHSKTLTITSLALHSIIGLPLNGYVVWLILRGARGTLASDFFPFNLAVSEIISTFSLIVYVLHERLHVFLFFELFMLSLGFYYTARPFFQCCICVECYVGVVHPVFFLRCKPLRYRAACCGVAWLIVLGSCLYFKYTFIYPRCLYGYFIQNLLLFSVMLFCCLSVVRVLKHPGPGEKATEKKKSNTMKRRAFKTILRIIISMGVIFFLYVVAIPLQCCFNAMVFTSILTICNSVALVIGFIQPICFLQRNGKLICFRKL